MAEFTVNPQRFDPYKNFKFRVKWDGRYVAGISKVGGLKRTTEVVKHREGGDPSSSRKSPGTAPRSFAALASGRVLPSSVTNCASPTTSLTRAGGGPSGRACAAPGSTTANGARMARHNAKRLRNEDKAPSPSFDVAAA